MLSFNKNQAQVNSHTKQKDSENTLVVTKGKGVGIHEAFGINANTPLCKIGNQQGTAAQRRELYSTFCNNLEGKGI